MQLFWKCGNRQPGASDSVGARADHTSGTAAFFVWFVFKSLNSSLQLKELGEIAKSFVASQDQGKLLVQAETLSKDLTGQDAEYVTHNFNLKKH